LIENEEIACTTLTILRAGPQAQKISAEKSKNPKIGSKKNFQSKKFQSEKNLPP
jgi:hypothetical protein